MKRTGPSKALLPSKKARIDNTIRLSKVWFARPDQHPLGGLLNEHRLKIHRLQFPDDVITLTSNFEDFPPSKQAHTTEFCKENNINLVSLNAIAEQIQHSTTYEDKDTQLALLDVARLEIDLDCGNLGAASDIVRTLSPVAKDKIYSDFDLIRKSEWPWDVEIKAPSGFLVDADFSFKDGLSVSSLSNASFFFDESKTSFLCFYRMMILDRYENLNISRLRDEEILNPEEILIAEKAIKEYEQEEEQSLPFVLKLRAALKCSVDQSCYETILKKLVEATSGPNCMMDVLTSIIQSEFIPYCQHNQIYDDKMIEAFINLGLPRQCPFRNEDDTSWILSLDTRQEKWEALLKATEITQSMVRMYNANILLRQKKEEKTNNTTQSEDLKNASCKL